MAATRLLMRRLRELLRLKYDAGLSHRAVAQACAMGLGTVTGYLQRATAAGLPWPLPDALDDAALEARLFARPAVPSARDRVVPDWSQLHQERKKPGVTLALLGSGVSAQTPPPGRLLAAQCAQCHGTNGNGPGFDELAGKSAYELYNDLLEMKSRTQIESIMDRQARGYTDDQLRLIADYLSAQTGSGSDD